MYIFHKNILSAILEKIYKHRKTQKMFTAQFFILKRIIINTMQDYIISNKEAYNFYVIKTIKKRKN